MTTSEAYYTFGAAPHIIRAGPGNVIVVRTESTFAKIIRFGAGWAGLPTEDNHVAIFTHLDPRGVPMGIEGRPGGTGWVDLRKYFNGPLARYTHTNWKQPLSASDRLAVVDFSKAMLGTHYDWDAIAQDAIDDIVHRELLLRMLDEAWRHGGTYPEAVVCSSLAAFAYDYRKLKSPSAKLGDRRVQPADWEKFIKDNGFE